MRGLAVLFGFLFVGGLLNHFGVPLPANVLGFLLLTIALLTGIVPMAWVEETAHFLLRHMVLLFVPYIVSTMVYFELIVAQFWPIALAVVVSTGAVLLVAGHVTQFLVRRTVARDVR